MAGRFWLVIAAAGAATRFGGSTPKPYLRIAGKSLIEHAILSLLALPDIAGGAVVIAANDRRYRRLPAALRRRFDVARGGATRALSVLHGLQALAAARDSDWVLVHDAARPCLPRRDLAALVARCRRDPVGGLLALPLADTLKQSDDESRIVRTIPRERLWRAQTPQMFRYGILKRALERARDQGFDATDEAAAVERLGMKPRLVAGSPLNVKVTRPADLAFAAVALRQARGGA